MDKVLFHMFSDDRFMDLTLYQYGYEQCLPLHSYGPFVRNHFLFHYVISGKGTLLVDDENSQSTEYQLQGGMGFLIEPDRVNTYFADRKDPWEYAWIEFSGLRAKEILEGSGLSSDSPVYLPRTPQDGERLKNEILYLATHSQESSYHLIGHLYLIMDALVSGSVFQTAYPGRQTCTVLHERSCDLHRPELFPCDHGRGHGSPLQSGSELFWQGFP